MKTLAHYRAMRADALAGSNRLRCDAPGCNGATLARHAVILADGTYCSVRCAERQMEPTTPATVNAV